LLEEQQALKDKKKAEFKAIGPTVEKKYIAAYDRITNALGEGNLKKAAEKVRPVVQLEAKGMRLGTAIVDNTVGAIASGFGVLADVVIAFSLVDDVWNHNRIPVKTYLKSGAVGIGSSILGKVILEQAPTRKAVMFMTDIGAAGGEKVIQIANKIFGRNPKGVVAPV